MFSRGRVRCKPVLLDSPFTFAGRFQLAPCAQGAYALLRYALTSCPHACLPTQVLAAHSILPVPSSPAMQICTVGAVYCYYRCMLHLEAWYAGDLPWFRALIGPWLALAGFRWTVSLVRRTLAHCIAMTIHV